MNVLIRNNRFPQKIILRKNIWKEVFWKLGEDKISDEENYDLINQVKEFYSRNIDKGKI